MAKREADDGGLEALLGSSLVGGEDLGAGDAEPGPSRGRRWLVVVPIAAGAALGFSALAYAVGSSGLDPIPVVSEAAHPPEDPVTASVTVPASGPVEFVDDTAYGVAPPQPSEPVTTMAPLPDQGAAGAASDGTSGASASTDSGTGSTTAPLASEPNSPSGGGETAPDPEPAPPPADRTPPGQIDNPGNGSPPGRAKK